MAAKFSPLGVAKSTFWTLWNLLDSVVITFKIPQDHHKITDDNIITFCHCEGSQHIFFPPDTREQQLPFIHPLTPPSQSFTPPPLLGLFSTPLTDIFIRYCILLTFFLFLCLYPPYLKSLTPNNG